MTYPARTIGGVEVQIASKLSDPQRGDVLVDTDGTHYVQDLATGYLVKTTDAPVAASSLSTSQEANASKDPEKVPAGTPDYTP